MEVEPEESGGAPKGILALLGVVMVLIGAVLVSIFVFRLQPPYVPPSSPPSTSEGVANIIMPAGVGQDQSLDFSPKNATVVVGVNDTVVWTNEDATSHTVVSRSVPSGAQSFQSGVLAKGDSFKVTLTVPGTYVYYCSIHPAWMVATIVVKAAG